MNTDPNEAAITALINDAKSRFEEAHLRWKEAQQAAAGAAKTHKENATVLAEIDSRLAVHLQHRDLVIEESGVTQLRGTFRLSRRLLATGAMLTTIGALLFALGLPSAEPSDNGATQVMRFTPGVPIPDEGEAIVVQIVGLAGQLEECGAQDLDGVLVAGPAEITEVVIGETAPASCQGEWLLPAGSWHKVSGREP